MNVLILLPMVSLWGVCHAGWPWCCFGGNRDDDDKVPLEITSFTPLEDNPTTRFYGQDGYGRPIQNPHVLDLTNQDLPHCQVFEYYNDGVPAKLIVPHGGQSITKLKDGSVTIWTAAPEQKLINVMFFLRDCKPEVVGIVTTISDTEIVRAYLCNNNGKWDDCTRTYGEWTKKLKVCVEHKGDFTLDISLTQDTDQCRIFQTTMLGRVSRFFFPKNGHHAMEVRHGSTIIWKAAAGERCIASSLYVNIEPPIVIVTYKSGDNLYILYLERNADKWKRIGKEECHAKLRMATRMMTTHSVA